jgi:hypothetical protein
LAPPRCTLKQRTEPDETTLIFLERLCGTAMLVAHSYILPAINFPETI